MLDPTDRSMPFVAITSAIPSATIAIGTTCTSCSRRFATLAKFWVNRRLKPSRTASATYTPWSEIRRRTTAVRAGAAAAAVSAIARPRDRGHDPVLADLVAGEHA